MAMDPSSIHDDEDFLASTSNHYKPNGIVSFTNETCCKNECALHRAVFYSSDQEVLRLLREGVTNISHKDIHGNTPLHLAVMLGDQRIVKMLLEYEASVIVKNNEGWSPIAEAISYGNKQMIKRLHSAMLQQADARIKNQGPQIFEALKRLNIGDFYMEIKWNFHTWVPLISHFFPSDTCKISKCAHAIRVDSTLIDLNEFGWSRGNLSLIFNLDSPETSILINHQKKQFEELFNKKSKKFTDEIDGMMSTDLISPKFSTKGLTFNKRKTGFLFPGDDTRELDGMKVQYYNIDGFAVSTKIRREHLTPAEIEENKTVFRKLITGAFSTHNPHKDASKAIRESILPPPKPRISWEQYLELPTNLVNLGRVRVEKTRLKHFNATVGMSEDFPLSLEVFVEILDLLATLNHVGKLREFLRTKLPPGFPVDLNIPLWPTVSAQIVFERFEWKTDFDPALFEVPPHYTKIGQSTT